jgi:hypothetical protein
MLSLIRVSQLSPIILIRVLYYSLCKFISRPLSTAEAFCPQQGYNLCFYEIQYSVVRSPLATSHAGFGNFRKNYFYLLPPVSIRLYLSNPYWLIALCYLSILLLSSVSFYFSSGSVFQATFFLVYLAASSSLTGSLLLYQNYNSFGWLISFLVIISSFHINSSILYLYPFVLYFSPTAFVFTLPIYLIFALVLLPVSHPVALLVLFSAVFVRSLQILFVAEFKPSNLLPLLVLIGLAQNSETPQWLKYDSGKPRLFNRTSLYLLASILAFLLMASLQNKLSFLCLNHSYLLAIIILVTLNQCSPFRFADEHSAFLALCYASIVCLIVSADLSLLASLAPFFFFSCKLFSSSSHFCFTNFCFYSRSNLLTLFGSKLLPFFPPNTEFVRFFYTEPLTYSGLFNRNQSLNQLLSKVCFDAGLAFWPSWFSLLQKDSRLHLSQWSDNTIFTSHVQSSNVLLASSCDLELLKSLPAFREPDLIVTSHDLNLAASDPCFTRDDLLVFLPVDLQ